MILRTSTSKGKTSSSSFFASKLGKFRGKRSACDKRYASESDQVGVVIVDHGSKRKASNLQLECFVDMYRSISGRRIVEAAHMELCQPDIECAFGRCVEQGATTVVVGPYFLSRGRHIQDDIPRLVEEASRNYPGVQYLIADPIGTDPLLAKIIENRISAKLEGIKGGESGSSQVH